jgi:voltage-gated potassium channel
VASSRPSPTHHPTARLKLFGGVLLLLIAAGTIGYRLIERWPWFDAFYKSVATLTSIGADVPLSTGGRVLTIVLALGGISTVALAATEVLRIIITGDLRAHLEGRKMQKAIDALEQHVIVCGYGRVGRHTCAHLRHANVTAVVIDARQVPVTAARAAGALTVLGDASADLILRRAGVDRARALVAAAGADPDNVLITMTARLLNPKLPIIARAVDEATVPKLLRAGATRTISPYAIGGGQMAEAVLRPSVVDFIEIATHDDLPDVRIAKKEVLPGSALEGTTVAASGLRSQLGLVLLAIKRRAGDVDFNPADDTVFDAGDTFIVVGRLAQLDRAGELALAR